MQVDWDQAIDMQESVAGWLKRQLLQRENKRRSWAEQRRPRKTSCTHSNSNFTASPGESERKKMAAWSLRHLGRYIILFLFDLVSSLLLSVPSKSFPLFYFFFFCCSFSHPPSCSPSHAHKHVQTPNKSRARRCEGCVSNLSQVQIKCFCYDKRCIAFLHSNTLLTFSFILIVWKVRHWTFDTDFNVWYICCVCHTVWDRDFLTSSSWPQNPFGQKLLTFVRSVWLKPWIALDVQLERRQN